MSDMQQDPGPKPAKRGEAKWNAERDSIAERNESARKAARQRRKADDVLRVRARRLAEQREMSEAQSQHGGS